MLSKSFDLSPSSKRRDPEESKGATKPIYHNSWKKVKISRNEKVLPVTRFKMMKFEQSTKEMKKNGDIGFPQSPNSKSCEKIWLEKAIFMFKKYPSISLTIRALNTTVIHDSIPNDWFISLLRKKGHQLSPMEICNENCLRKCASLIKCPPDKECSKPERNPGNLHAHMTGCFQIS